MSLPQNSVGHSGGRTTARPSSERVSYIQHNRIRRPPEGAPLEQEPRLYPVCLPAIPVNEIRERVGNWRPERCPETVESGHLGCCFVGDATVSDWDCVASPSEHRIARPLYGLTPVRIPPSPPDFFISMTFAPHLARLDLVEPRVGSRRFYLLKRLSCDGFPLAETSF